MKTSEVLYKAAKKMRTGFCPNYGNDECGCFVQRLESIDGWSMPVFAAMQDLLGSRWYDADRLVREGWDTDDAVAAFTIAADIVCANGD